jgi:hypothetical protein
MRTIISQSVVLPASAESLFAMYTDPAKHAAITGAAVTISVEPGSPFQAFEEPADPAQLKALLAPRFPLLRLPSAKASARPISLGSSASAISPRTSPTRSSMGGSRAI